MDTVLLRYANIPVAFASTNAAPFAFTIPFASMCPNSGGETVAAGSMLAVDGTSAPNNSTHTGSNLKAKQT